jgi:hydrogenase/urease accessory protein HupE
MSSRKFASIFIAIFILGAFPLLLVQPSGAASAGLSAGFSIPVQHIPLMFLFIGIGIWATVLGSHATALLPLGITLMLLIGGLLGLSHAPLSYLKWILLLAIVLFAVVVSGIRSKPYLVSITVLGSAAYHIGSYYMHAMPPVIATAHYYLLGVLVSNMLIMGIGICIGITLIDDTQKWIERLRNKMPANAFLSFFL